MTFYTIKDRIRLVKATESYRVKDGDEVLASFDYANDEVRRNTLQRLDQRDAIGLAALLAFALDDQA